jgi:hypothetical protein
MLRVIYLAPGVLSMLFQRSLAIVMLAICVVSSPVIDEVPTGCDSDLVGICFLGAMINNHPRVRNNSVLEDVWDVGGEHDEHCICSLLARLVVALTHPSKVFSKCCHPNLCSHGIINQAFIAADDFAGDRVNHGHGIVFKVLEGGVCNRAVLKECSGSYHWSAPSQGVERWHPG